MKKTILTMALMGCMLCTQAQKVTCYTTTEGEAWQQSRTTLSSKPQGTTVATVEGTEEGTVFRAWGTTFNELDWDAFNLLSRDEQDEVMHRLFAPDGDLRFTHGRVSMNANDYARSWYSCDDVVGDLGLRHFNIERDKRNIIPLARAAQKYCPQLQLFMSPWSPPAWMKINHDYPVVPSPHNTMDSRQGYLLYMDDGRALDPDEMKLLGDRDGVFPRRLASQDYFIQDPRYLQCYADMFCRFIDLYAEQGLPITKVMYQNEAYSYTPYPGCAWTAEGTLRFNNDYLAPTLAKHHPEVELWIGTFNTNRLDYVEKILDDATLQANVKGVGTQWECRNNLPRCASATPTCASCAQRASVATVPWTGQQVSTPSSSSPITWAMESTSTTTGTSSLPIMASHPGAGGRTPSYRSTATLAACATPPSTTPTSTSAISWSPARRWSPMPVASLAALPSLCSATLRASISSQRATSPPKSAWSMSR